MYSDTPLGAAYVEGLLFSSTRSGPTARLELGAHPLAPLALFAFGEWTPGESTAGGGFKVTF